MSCDNWRGIESRIDWFLASENYPSQSGMCAQHTWHALGGDQGCPERWNCPDANAVADKLKAAGKLYTEDVMNPPRGAEVVWKYGNYGHAALSLGPDSWSPGVAAIATTDPSNGKPTGIEPITYPQKWGASNGGRPTGWSDYYSGTTYAVGEKEEDMTPEQEEQLVTKIVKRVVQAMGDYTFEGEPQETENGKNDNGAQRLRKIWEKGVKDNPNIP